MRHMTTLSYLDMVAKTGSIRAAADRLSITASALNRRILAIEEELGVALFERHAGGVVLNSAGELFIHHIRTQTADLARVRSRIADLQGNRRGHIRLAASRAVAQAVLPGHIARYQERFPGVTCNLLSQDGAPAQQALRALEVDVLMTLDAIEQPDLHVLALAPAPVMCLMRADHALAGQSQVSLADVLQQPVAVPPKGDPLRTRLDLACARSALDLTPTLESDDPVALAQLTAQGAALSFTTRFHPRPVSDTRQVQRPLRSPEVQPLLLSIVQRKGGELPVASAKFVELMRAWLEETPLAVSAEAS